MKQSRGNIILAVVVILAVVGAGLVLALNTGFFSAGPSETASDKAVLEGDVQNVTSELTASGYPDLVVEAGVPVRWNLHVAEGELTSCNNALVIPEYGLEVNLQEGDNIIEFTPEKTGRIPYSCWMGMINAEITVVDDLSSADRSVAAQQSNDSNAINNEAGGAATIPSCCDIQD